MRLPAGRAPLPAVFRGEVLGLGRSGAGELSGDKRALISISNRKQYL